MSADTLSVLVALFVFVLVIAGAAVLLVGLLLIAGFLLLALVAVVAELVQHLSDRLRRPRESADQGATAISPNE